MDGKREAQGLFLGSSMTYSSRQWAAGGVSAVLYGTLIRGSQRSWRLELVPYLD